MPLLEEWGGVTQDPDYQSLSPSEREYVSRRWLASKKSDLGKLDAKSRNVVVSHIRGIANPTAGDTAAPKAPTVAWDVISEQGRAQLAQNPMAHIGAAGNRAITGEVSPEIQVDQRALPGTEDLEYAETELPIPKTYGEAIGQVPALALDVAKNTVNTAKALPSLIANPMAGLGFATRTAATLADPLNVLELTPAMAGYKAAAGLMAPGAKAILADLAKTVAAHGAASAVTEGANGMVDSAAQQYAEKGVEGFSGPQLLRDTLTEAAVGIVPGVGGPLAGAYGGRHAVGVPSHPNQRPEERQAPATMDGYPVQQSGLGMYPNPNGLLAQVPGNDGVQTDESMTPELRNFYAQASGPQLESVLRSYNQPAPVGMGPAAPPAPLTPAHDQATATRLLTPGVAPLAATLPGRSPALPGMSAPAGTVSLGNTPAPPILPAVQIASLRQQLDQVDRTDLDAVNALTNQLDHLLGNPLPPISPIQDPIPTEGWSAERPSPWGSERAAELTARADAQIGLTRKQKQAAKRKALAEAGALAPLKQDPRTQPETMETRSFTDPAYEETAAVTPPALLDRMGRKQENRNARLMTDINSEQRLPAVIPPDFPKGHPSTWTPEQTEVARTIHAAEQKRYARNHPKASGRLDAAPARIIPASTLSDGELLAEWRRWLSGREARQPGYFEQGDALEKEFDHREFDYRDGQWHAPDYSTGLQDLSHDELTKRKAQATKALSQARAGVTRAESANAKNKTMTPEQKRKNTIGNSLDFQEESTKEVVGREKQIAAIDAELNKRKVDAPAEAQNDEAPAHNYGSMSDERLGHAFSRLKALRDEIDADIEQWSGNREALDVLQNERAPLMQRLRAAQAELRRRHAAAAKPVDAPTPEPTTASPAVAEVAKASDAKAADPSSLSDKDLVAAYESANAAYAGMGADDTGAAWTKLDRIITELESRGFKKHGSTYRKPRAKDDDATPGAFTAEDAEMLQAAMSKAVEEVLFESIDAQGLPGTPTGLIKFAEDLLGRPMRDHTDFIYDALESALNRLQAAEWRPGSTLTSAMHLAYQLEAKLPRTRPRTDGMREKQQFSTPLPLSTGAQYMADVGKNDIVLEPTAGTGNLVNLVSSMPGVSVTAIEIDPRRVQAMEAAGVIGDVRQGDYLKTRLGNGHDVVITNPPWGSISTGKYGKWDVPQEFKLFDATQRFVAKSLSELSQGGRLVVVAPEGMTVGDPRMSPFINWLKQSGYTVTASIKSPPLAYQRRGTEVGSVTLVIDKVRTDTSTLRVDPADYDAYLAAAERLFGEGDHSRAAIARRETTAPAPAPKRTPPKPKPAEQDADQELADIRKGREDAADFDFDDIDGDKAPPAPAPRPAPPAPPAPKPAPLSEKDVEAAMDVLGDQQASLAESILADLFRDERGEFGPGAGLDPAKRAKLIAAAKAYGNALVQRGLNNIREWAVAMKDKFKGLYDHIKSDLKEIYLSALDWREASIVAIREGKSNGNQNQGAEGASGATAPAGRPGREPGDAAPDAPTRPGEVPGDGTRGNARPDGDRGDARPNVDDEAAPKGEGSGRTVRPGDDYSDDQRGARFEDLPSSGDRRIDAERRKDFQDASGSSVFGPYLPRRDRSGRGRGHVRLVVETRALQGVPYPTLEYVAHDAVQAALDRGSISSDQIDIIEAAGQANDRGHGILISDDVGLGKSREVAGIALDWLASGKSKRLIVSTKNAVNVGDLIREFGIVAGGAFPYQIHHLTGDAFKNQTPSAKQRGKYEALPKTDKPTIYIVDYYNMDTFAEALGEWGPDAWIADEAHMFKNVDGTNRGKAWANLHAQLLRNDKSRIAYTTATPGADLNELKYLFGLRAWTPGKSGFADWLRVVTGNAPPPTTAAAGSTRGPAAPSAGAEATDAGPGGNSRRGAPPVSVSPAEQEQIMREWKMDGRYISRDLWRGGVEFEATEVPLEQAAIESYAEFAELAHDVMAAFKKFKGLDKSKKSPPPTSLLQFEAKLRQYSERLDRAIEIAQEAIANGERPVISLINTTGEAMATVGDDGKTKTRDVPTGGYLMGAINMINERMTEMDSDSGELITLDENVHEAVIAKEELRERVARLRPVLDPIQRITTAFGGESRVAVITGAKSADKRKAEMASFQDDSKKVAVISKAGKTGISLHDEHGHGRRVLIVADFEWSATEFKQELGRVDRSGQRSAPRVKVLHSGIAGEKKFVSTIAVRMKGLGAVSKGASESTGTEALEDFELGGTVDNMAVRTALNTYSTEDLTWFMDPSISGGKSSQFAGIDTAKFLLNLQFMPMDVSEGFFNSFMAERGRLRDQVDAYMADRKTSKTTGDVRRKTEVDAGTTIYEVEPVEGPRFGLVVGRITDKIHRLKPILFDREKNRTQRTYITFRSSDGKQQLTGLRIPTTAIQQAKGLLGAKTKHTPESAWNDLLAGDTVHIGKGWALKYRTVRKDVEVLGVNRKNADEATPHGAIWDAVSNKVVIRNEADLAKFIKRFPIADAADVFTPKSATLTLTRNNRAIKYDVETTATPGLYVFKNEVADKYLIMSNAGALAGSAFDDTGAAQRAAVDLAQAGDWNRSQGDIARDREIIHRAGDITDKIRRGEDATLEPAAPPAPKDGADVTFKHPDGTSAQVSGMYKETKRGPVYEMYASKTGDLPLGSTLTVGGKAYRVERFGQPFEHRGAVPVQRVYAYLDEQPAQQSSEPAGGDLPNTLNDMADALEKSGLADWEAAFRNITLGSTAGNTRAVIAGGKLLAARLLRATSRTAEALRTIRRDFATENPKARPLMAAIAKKAEEYREGVERALDGMFAEAKVEAGATRRFTSTGKAGALALRGIAVPTFETESVTRQLKNFIGAMEEGNVTRANHTADAVSRSMDSPYHRMKSEQHLDEIDALYEYMDAVLSNVPKATRQAPGKMTPRQPLSDVDRDLSDMFAEAGIVTDPEASAQRTDVDDALDEMASRGRGERVAQDPVFRLSPEERAETEDDRDAARDDMRLMEDAERETGDHANERELLAALEHVRAYRDARKRAEDADATLAADGELGRPKDATEAGAFDLPSDAQANLWRTIQDSAERLYGEEDGFFIPGAFTEWMTKVLGIKEPKGPRAPARVAPPASPLKMYGEANARPDLAKLVKQAERLQEALNESDRRGTPLAKRIMLALKLEDVRRQLEEMHTTVTATRAKATEVANTINDPATLPHYDGEKMVLPKGINFWRLDMDPEAKDYFAGVLGEYEPQFNFVAGTKARGHEQVWQEGMKLLADGDWDTQSLLKHDTTKPLDDAHITASRILMATVAGQVHQLSKAKQADTARLTASERDARDAGLRRGIELLSAMSAQVEGATKSIARALSAHRIMAASQTSVERQIKAILENKVDGIDAVADAIANLDDVESIIHTARKEVARDTWQHKVLEFWVMAILSAPITHARNVFGNLFNALGTVGEETMAFGIGKLFREDNHVSGDEVAAQWAAFWSSMPDAARIARLSWKENAPVSGTSQIDAHEGAIKGKAGDFIRTPGRALMAEDEFFKVIAYRMSLAQQAVAEARSQAQRKGLTDDERKALVTQLTFDPTDDMVDIAISEAHYRTFQEKMGDIGGMLLRAKSSVPAISFIIPFVKTPVNIVKYAHERSILAPFADQVQAELQAGGARRDRALAKMAFGTTLMGMAALMAAIGLITGSGPEDPDDKATLMATGWRPYSLHLGGYYMPFNQATGAYGILAGSMGDIMDRWNSQSSPEKRDNALISQLTDTVIIGGLVAIRGNVVEQTFLKGLHDFANMVYEPKQFAQRWAGNLIAGFVPNAVAKVADAIDPLRREQRGDGLADEVARRMQAKIPGASMGLPAQLDLTGKPIERNTYSRQVGLTGLPFPAYPGTEKNDKLLSEMVRLGENASKAPRKLDIGGKDIPLTAELRREYGRIKGEEFDKLVRKAVESERWDALTEENQRKVFERYRAAASEVATAKFKRDNYDFIRTALQAGR